MHSIVDLSEKIKCRWQKWAHGLPPIADDVFLALIIILVAFGSFGLGRLSAKESRKTQVRFENVPELNSVQTPQKSTLNAGIKDQTANVLASTESEQLVGSKNGTKYYYPWCSGVQKISPANLIHFDSKESAEARGYTPSAACKGL